LQEGYGEHVCKGFEEGRSVCPEELPASTILCHLRSSEAQLDPQAGQLIWDLGTQEKEGPVCFSFPHSESGSTIGSL
jgi:hypothetical protein